MRVLQLIDTLRPAGAERVAVNYANLLASHIEKSFLCATRAEGLLRDELDDRVGYIFLQKRKRIDLKAFRKLNAFVVKHKIDIIHAHATSYFTGWVIKKSNPKTRLIWHIHHGHYPQTSSWKTNIYSLVSRSCFAIFTVNEDLRIWASHALKCKNIFYIKNFVIDKSVKSKALESLRGMQSKRIVCVANFRIEKNHGLLLDAFKQVRQEIPEASLHLYGMAYEDIYSKSIEAIAEDMEQVYYHGLHPNLSALLPHYDLGVLSSDSEGLPLALLEYAQAALPVVVTDVGQCHDVVSGHGRCVQAGNRDQLANAMFFYLNDPDKRKTDGRSLKEHVLENYGANAVLTEVLKHYEACI